MMKFFKDKRISAKKEMTGFAMLFAVLASSLLIAIGISIFTISYKELQIATSEEASQVAYYAADSAEECALYWDIKIGSFPSCTNSSCSSVSTSTNNTIACNGNSITLNFTHPVNSLIYTYTSPASPAFFSNGAPNASIFVMKTFVPGNVNTNTPDTIQTSIIAQGQNSAAIGDRVERGLSETYNSQ